VQSVALRLVAEREAEIEAHVAREYWSVSARLRTPGGLAIDARLSQARPTVTCHPTVSQWRAQVLLWCQKRVTWRGCLRSG